MLVGTPAERLRRTLQAVLRLTGLPASSIYPRAVVRPAEGRIEIVFMGEEGTTRIDVDLRLLGPAADDLEAVQLDLLAKLQSEGYESRVAARGRRPRGLTAARSQHPRVPQALTSPCGSSTNFLAAPLSKSW